MLFCQRNSHCTLALDHTSKLANQNFALFTVSRFIFYEISTMRVTRQYEVWLRLAFEIVQYIFTCCNSNDQYFGQYSRSMIHS